MRQIREHGSTRIREASRILVFALSLTACGFQPIHGQAYRDRSGADLSVFAIEVVGTDLTPEEGGRNTNIPRRYSELLKAELTDQLTPNAATTAPQYRLSITFTELESGQFVNPDGTASRGDLIYNSQYSIARVEDREEITRGSITRVSSYNMSQSADYASYVSIEDARKRGMIELAQDYKLRLAALMPMLSDPNSVLNNPPPKKEPLPAASEDWAPHIQPRSTYETLRP